MNFIQAGDFHLDTYYSDPKLSKFKALEDLEAFGKICQVVLENKADFLFLTGDIFDNAGIKKETLTYISNKLFMIPETRVFISPGNHDYVGRNSAYLNFTWPSNVHIFKEFESVILDDKKVIITGAGFTSQNQESSLFPLGYKHLNKYQNILVMHGEIGSKGFYNPLTESVLNRFTYCALGHVHEYQFKKNSLINYAYSGSPVARNFNEEGEHGYIAGHIDDVGVTYKFVPLEGKRFRTETFDISGIETNEILKDNIISGISGEIERGNLKNEDILRIILIGESELDINLDYLEEGLKNFFNIGEISDNSEVPYDYEKLKDEPSIQGLFTQKMISKYSMDPLSAKALKRGLKALRSEYFK